MDIASFDVKTEYFNHPSWLHSENHTCRVMSLVWAIGNELGWVRERDLALCAAYIHDMARDGDGICRVHGSRAAEEKLPLFRSFFIEQGIRAEDIPVIETAVRNHSQLEELETNHPHYTVTALLKDADAMDRCRLGPFDLDKRYLRLPATLDHVGFAKKLFIKTSRKRITGFINTLETLESITGKIYPRN